MQLFHPSGDPGPVACRTADIPRSAPVPITHHRRRTTMDPKLIEWGPAHLRDEATRPELEMSERPDDN
jgi:hypothetical protein